MSQPSPQHSAADLEGLKDWIGRSMSLSDTLAPWPIEAMNATLDHELPQPELGDAIPACWHWLYFNPAAPAHDIGEDGHPKRGTFAPPVPLPRRMWAGSRLNFLQPMRIGSRYVRHSTIADVTIKQGRSGLLCFTTVKHSYDGPEGRVLDEEHDIVYRDNPDPSAAPVVPPTAPPPGEWTRGIDPDPVLLFRYSALTFNGHRIHYDYPYVTEVEGYPGLIVHGPLIATLLLDLARRKAPERTVAAYRFKAVSPLFSGVRFTVNGQPDGDTARLWATNPQGQLAMEATVTFA